MADGPFRVLHVLNQMGLSGAENSLRQILTAMPTDEIRHEVFSLDPVNNRFDELLAAGIPCGRPPSALTSRGAAVRLVHGVIAQRDPDLVHTTLFEADLVGRVAASLARRPVLTSFVNDQYSSGAASVATSRVKLGAARWIDGLLARHATTYYHAITEAIADSASRTLRIDRAAIRVVPRGRSVAALGGPATDERRRQARDALGISGGAVLLNIARQDPQKDHVTLIRAFSRLRAAGVEATLVLVGRAGNSTPAIEAEQCAGDSRSAILVLGERDDVGDLLCAADIFVFPSLWEGLGGAVLEAMAMGVPVVASDLPALREVLADGECGRLVPPAEPEAFARAIRDLVEDPTGAASMAERATERYRQHYTLDACVAGMTRLYADIAGTERGRRARR